MKRTIRENYRLELIPDTTFLRASTLTNHESMRAFLAEIERAVRRHVDDVEGLAARWDTREECSHCGLAWEVLTAADAADPRNVQDEHSVEGEPVCCEKAIFEFRIEHGITPLADGRGGEDA